MLRVLFVCTGNICRSPTAERLTAALVEQSGRSDIAVSSAGTRAVVGRPIHSEAALVLRSLGGDDTNFTSRRLTPLIAYEADLVLTMTEAHRDAVLVAAPRMLRQTYTLIEAAKIFDLGARSLADLVELRPCLGGVECRDVSDPIGMGREAFESIGSQIADLVHPVAEFCVKVAGR